MKQAIGWAEQTWSSGREEGCMSDETGACSGLESMLFYLLCELVRPFKLVLVLNDSNKTSQLRAGPLLQLLDL